MKFINAKMTFIHMKSFIYKHIHPCRWMKITLNFNYKFKVPSSSFTLMHKSSSHDAHFTEVLPMNGLVTLPFAHTPPTFAHPH